MLQEQLVPKEKFIVLIIVFYSFNKHQKVTVLLPPTSKHNFLTVNFW